MTRHKTTYKLFVTTIIIFLFACQSYESPVDKVLREHDRLTTSQKEWQQMKSKSDKLVFKKYYLRDSTIAWDPQSVVWVDSTTNLDKIERFRTLFVHIKDGGYCCCPSGHYSVSFYKDTTLLGEYLVDTATTKNQAMFYDHSYQTSFHIDLRDWNSFLKEK